MCPTSLSFQPIFSKFAPIIHWTIFQTPEHFRHHLVTFVATRGPNVIFLVCALQPLVFNQSFPNCTNYSLDHTPDTSTYLSPFSYICGHWGANFVEYDLCSGRGGGGPGIHHRSAGDQTLLVHVCIHNCCSQ